MWEDRTDAERLEVGIKISKGLLGKKNRLGQKNTPEHTAKIAAAIKGQKRTPEQRLKMSVSAKTRKRKSSNIGAIL